MVESSMFDVFLAHNTADKPKVRAIAEQLKRRGLKPWLDEEQIAPGRSFQEEIQKVIPLVQSAAIFIGLEGLGKWQVWELRSLISQCVEEDIPVIPVLLPGVDGIPERFRFLQEFNWVSFEKIDDAAALYRLVWGITGVKPSVQSSNKEVEKRSQQQPKREQILLDLMVFEFDVVTVEVKQSTEVQRTGLFGLKEEVKISSNVTLNRSHSQAECFTENLGNNISLDMVYISGGTFMMGSPEGEGRDREKPQHEVTVPPFYMGKYPITQAQYQQVMSKNPSNFKKGDDRPVEKVSWNDAVEFCQRLSQQTGTEYRLPTEAEWEYACRAGTETPFHFGETISTDLANYRGTDWEYEGEVYPGNYERGLKGIYREQTTPVGYFQVANNFGLCDMHGLVWEWCQDDWHDSYKNAPTDGSAWIQGESSKKVVRGGSWFNNPHNCRSAIRNNITRDYRIYNIGFRVVCVAPRAT